MQPWISLSSSFRDVMTGITHRAFCIRSSFYEKKSFSLKELLLRLALFFSWHFYFQSETHFTFFETQDVKKYSTSLYCCLEAEKEVKNIKPTFRTDNEQNQWQFSSFLTWQVYLKLYFGLTPKRICLEAQHTS